MPLEHFGTESWHKNYKRPLSDISAHRRYGSAMSRISSEPDGAAAGEEHENERESDRAILSKLTGVSRSVSWGRGTSQRANREQPNSAAPAPLAGPGKRRQPPSLSLHMSASHSPDTSRDPDSPSSKTSSPASSAALSLRSLSAVDNEGLHRRNSSRSKSLYSAAPPQVYEATAMSELSSPKVPAHTWPEHTEPLTSPAIPVESVPDKHSPTSYPAPVLEIPKPKHMPPQARRGSLLDLEHVPIRRHIGSFHLRKQSSNPDLSQSMHSIVSAVDNDDAAAADAQGRAGLVRFFSRFFHEGSSRAPSSGTASPSFSPPWHAQRPTPDSRHSFSAGRPSHAAPFIILARQALPRPPRSPMVTSSDVHEEDLDEIHGLTTRSSTPVRCHSPPKPNAAEGPDLSRLCLDHDSLDTHSLDAYEVREEMGRGAYGFVRRASSRENGDEVVIKYIIKNSIFADAWRRHRVYGTIPSEIFVLLQLQHTMYTPPPTPPPYITNKAHWESVRNEIVHLQREGHTTGHPGICKLLDFFEDEEFYYMVMPRFGDGQDLFNYVESSPYGLEPRQIRNFLGQVADVMTFMHANGIVHRDIKDENVILDSNGMVQLIDFGGAARVRPGALFDTFSGTMDYAALEILQGEKYAGPPQDVWAFGVLGYVLVCGECPFADVDEARVGMSHDSRALLVLQHFCHKQSSVDGDSTDDDDDDDDDDDHGHHAHGDDDDHDYDHDDIPTADGGGRLPQLCDLICQCLQQEPSMRPSANEILRHAFLQGASGWSGLRGWRSLPSIEPGPRKGPSPET